MIRSRNMFWHAVGVAASFIVKAWTKRGADDIAIRTIWNHEVRNLLRLDGLPRAEKEPAGSAPRPDDRQGR